MDEAQRDDDQNGARGSRKNAKRLATGGRRRSGALLLCIVELNERRVGLLGVGVLVYWTQSSPTDVGEYEHTDDGKTDHAGGNAQQWRAGWCQSLLPEALEDFLAVVMGKA